MRLNYEELLGRCSFESKVSGGSRITLEDFHLNFKAFHNKKGTTISNLNEISKRIGHSLDFMQKFFQQGTYSLNRKEGFFIHKVRKEPFERAVNSYYSKIYLCKNCRSPDTSIQASLDKYECSCKACGYRRNISPLG